MGIGSITEAGFSNNNTLVVGSEQKMIEIAGKVIIVADHTKFGRGGMFPVAPLSAADIVVSDSELAPDMYLLVREVFLALLTRGLSFNGISSRTSCGSCKSLWQASRSSS
jgi:DeoR/GlpR family transcriptional regulator of sugar metabolism